MERLEIIDSGRRRCFGREKQLQIVLRVYASGEAFDYPHRRAGPLPRVNLP